MSDTICALSTPPGLAALGIIRLSGPEAGSICDLRFRPRSSFGLPSHMKGYTMAYGSWTDAQGQVLDQVILAAFRAPHSYTGEDLYEISFHGGSQVRNSILESLLASGARPASAGEFSKRAFLNGKLDLAQAEAVMDLIEAESRLQQDQALRDLSGSLSQAVEDLKDQVLTLMAHLENILEFSEENAESSDIVGLKEGLKPIRTSIQQALAHWSQGRILNDKFRVCILGLPNAGKSTLLNALMGLDRAIVSDVSGTTRDTLEANLQVAGIPVLLTDTAGLRQTADLVEREGVDRALTAAQAADLVFWLHDPQRLPESQEALASYRSTAPDQKILALLGKQDLYSEAERRTQAQALDPEPVLAWSQVHPELLDPIRDQIKAAYDSLGSGQAGNIFLHNLRHKALLEEAKQALDMAAQSLDDPGALDMTAAMLRSAEEALASLSGSQVSDELVESIFSRFCVGK